MPFRSCRSRVFVLLLLLGLVLPTTIASIILGSNRLDLTTLYNGIVEDPTSEAGIIVWDLRIPRTALALVAGAALGVSGALMQGHTRNPIADPVVLGVSSGAGLFVVGSIFLLNVTSIGWQVAAGFLGALLAFSMVFLVSVAASGGHTPITLALAGAAAGALFTAITGGLILADQRSLETYRNWTVGTVAERPLPIVLTLLPFVLVGLVLAFANAEGLNALTLDDDSARSIGVNVGGTRVTGVVSIALLTGSAVAACGPISFIGLAAAHIGRRIVGSDYRWLVPASLILGALLLTTADVIGRIVLPSGELAAGITSALIGAPLFVYLVQRPQPVRL